MYRPLSLIIGGAPKNVTELELMDRIFEGHPVPHTTTPWLVLIGGTIVDELDLWCSGSILSEKLVITSAQCIKKKFEDTQINKLKVYSRRQVVDDMPDIFPECNSETSSVKKINVHDKYEFKSDSKIYYDFAILELNCPISREGDPSAIPVQLPSADFKPEVSNPKFTVSGYGRDYLQVPTSPGHGGLQSATVSWIDDKRCKGIFGVKKFHPSWVCAGGNEVQQEEEGEKVHVNTGACEGDKGGDLGGKCFLSTNFNICKDGLRGS